MIASHEELARYPHFGFPGGRAHGVAEVPNHVFWDPRWFCQWLSIRPKEGNFVGMQLQSQQWLMAQEYLVARSRGQWLVQVKPRQLGSSTFFTAVLFWTIYWRPGMRACIMGYKQPNAWTLSKHVMGYYDRLPAIIKQFGPKKNNLARRNLDLPNPHGSYCATAGVKDDNPERGETNQFGLATELSTWEDDKAVDAWKAYRSTIPREHGILIAESTPRYVDDALHLVWQESFEEDSRWHRVFIPWYVVPEYQATPVPGWTPRSDVREYWDKYPDLTERHIYWMQAFGLPACGTSRGSASIDVFMSEYPYDPHECWLAAGEAIFDRAAILRRVKELSPTGGAYSQPATTELWYEGHPQAGHRYVLAVDPASSVADRDKFGYVLLDLDTFETAYDRLEHTTASKAGRVCRDVVDAIKAVGGTVVICVEANGIGDSLLTVLHELGLQQYIVWTKHSTDRKARPRMGWWSSFGTKTEAIVTAQNWVVEEVLVIHSIRMLEQLRGYRDQWSKNRDNLGGHYDLVAALCIACWYVKYHGRKPQPRRVVNQMTELGMMGPGVLRKLLSPGHAGRKTDFGETL